MAVSDTGLIVGSSMVSTGYLHAFLYDDAMRDLGTLGGTVSAAYGINSLGHAIGLSFDGQGRQRAFVWHDGVMYDLNSLIDPASGWTLEAAYGINELGQIVGTGRNGAKHSAFVLDWHGGSSDDPAGAAVPEPGTGLLSAGAACVLAMVAALRRRRSFRAAD
jgi:probable HAF family extracellular repeat protein